MTTLLAAAVLLIPQGKFSLFNGKDLTGWHADVPEMDTNKSARMPFIVRDGMLVSLGTPGGHLITDRQYENYRWRLSIALRLSRETVGFWFMLQSPGCCTECSRSRLRFRCRAETRAISGASARM